MVVTHGVGLPEISVFNRVAGNLHRHSFQVRPGARARIINIRPNGGIRPHPDIIEEVIAPTETPLARHIGVQGVDPEMAAGVDPEITVTEDMITTIVIPGITLIGGTTTRI